MWAAAPAAAMTAYASIIRAPGVGVLLLAATIVRLSPAMNSLAILLFVDEVSGSFAAAGAAVGAFSLGTALGSPLVARLSDGRGLAVIAPFALAHAGALVGLWALGTADAATAVLVVAALAAGATYPPTGAALRARWPVLVPVPELIPSAYALDSVAASVAFLTGPLITALLVALSGPGPALPLGAGAVLLATAVFIARAPSLDRRRGSAGWLGAMAGPGMRTLTAFIFAAGFSMGTVEVAIAGFATDLGREALAGLLLSLWSVASALASLAYGPLSLRLPLSLRAANLAAAVALPLASLPIALAGSPAVMALLLIVSGLPFAPMFVATNQLVGEVAPRGTATEAYSWIITAMVAGTALGAASAGALVELSSWQLAVVCGAAVGMVGAILLALRRSTLAPVSALQAASPSAIPPPVADIATAITRRFGGTRP